MTVPVTPRLFLGDTPFLDVRAQVEFERGAFPTAVNMPILDDAERERIGICYKEQGPEAAVRLGHQLVSGEVKAGRVAAWTAFVEANPDAHLYCFRGGQRSQIAEQWLREAGITIPRIEGGYKAMRRLLLEVFDALPRLVIIAGKTGVGKTLWLEELPADTVVDLERHANHRGSAFGKRLSPQPSQIDFENRVAIDLLRSGPLVFVEDESRTIGRSHLPLPLQQAMKSAPLLLLEDSLDNRVERILAEYVVEALKELRCHDPADPAVRLRERLQAALDAIQKRLGGVLHRELSADLEAAFAAGADDFAGHRVWIRKLLTDYYDPMYEYQLRKKADRVIGLGDREQLLDQALAIIARGAAP